MPSVLVGTITLPSRGAGPGIAPTPHCHPPTPVLTPILSLASKVFIGTSKASPVVMGQPYTPTTCGDTAHAPLVIQSIPNIFIGPTKFNLSYVGAGLSCGDSVNGDPTSRVFVKI